MSQNYLKNYLKNKIMKHLKGFKIFENSLEYKVPYKLISKNEMDIIEALKWFRGNTDISNGFVTPVTMGVDNWEDGKKITVELVEDHIPQYIKKTDVGYEIGVNIFNYDGKIIQNPTSDLDFINKLLTKDNIRCEIVKVN